MNEIIYHGDWERIDKRLTQQFDYSRNFFHHIIQRGWISVQDKPVKKSYKLKKWNRIIIDDLERYLSPVILEEAPDIDLDIKIEKEDYLVIYKPKGVLSHPNSVRDVSYPSVVGFLYHHYKNLPTVGNFIRSGLIHRLDKDTDGLMIVVKTEKWLAHFKSLFQQKSEAETIADKELIPLKKFYRASCNLSLLGEEFIQKIANNFPYIIEEMVIPKVPHSVPKMWITKILEIEKNKETIDIKIEILTWRTHQIRYHLSNHGLPIVWDYIYGKEEDLPMQLTAWKLDFYDSEGENIVVDI